MVSLDKVINVDGTTIYVKVVVDDRRMSIVWDKNIPFSTIKRLLMMLMPYVASLLEESNKSAKHDRNASILHTLEQQNGYSINNTTREYTKKLRHGNTN
ncbi:MAG: hypothetical protein J7L51_02975 [Desulfurococcales archaeon]|nr:hypothetical protein [Desulfurococcales archaeon]